MMKTREFYEAISNGEMTDEIKAFAVSALEKLDETNEKRRERDAQKRAEKDLAKASVRAAAFDVLTDEPKTASTIIADAGLDVTPQSIPSLLKPFIENGTVAKTDVKVKGKGTQRGYVRTDM